MDYLKEKLVFSFISDEFIKYIKKLIEVCGTPTIVNHLQKLMASFVLYLPNHNVFEKVEERENHCTLYSISDGTSLLSSVMKLFGVSLSSPSSEKNSKSSKKKKIEESVSSYLSQFDSLQHVCEGDLRQEGFSLIFWEDVLVIIGNSLRSLLYGLYEFFSYLGIRWFFPGEEFEYIPDLSSMPSFYSVVSFPKNRIRGLLINGTPRVLRNWVDFAAKHKLNYIGFRSVKDYMTVQQDMYRRNLQGDLYLQHLGNDFCTVEKDSFKASVNHVLKAISDLPLHHTSLHLWQDPLVSKCTCKHDRKFHLSDQILYRLNLIVNLSKMSSKTIGFLATLNSWNPPSIIKPHPRITLDLMPNHRCFSHALNDPLCRRNKFLVYPAILSYIKLFGIHRLRYFGSWFNLSLFSLSKFSYLGKVQKLGKNRIPQLLKLIKKDVLFLNNLKIHDIVAMALDFDRDYFKTFTVPSISYYGEILWNPNVEVGDLLRDFCEKYFGIDKVGWFFDEMEMLDSVDLTRPRFKGYIDLTKKRIELLENYLEKTRKIPRKQRYRIKRFLFELKIRTHIPYGFWGIKLMGTARDVYTGYKLLRD